MTCCGNRRALTGVASADGAWVEFQLIGPKAITVFGPLTRHQYRFSGPGARVAVETRDARSIEGGPNLRRVGEAYGTLGSRNSCNRGATTALVRLAMVASFFSGPGARVAVDPRDARSIE